MKKIIFYILILLVVIAPIAYAATDQYTLLEPLPCIPGSGNVCTVGEPMKTIGLDTYIQYIFRFSIALAVFLAVVMIIWGGFEYMLSEAFTSKSNAKSRIQNAVLGLLGALVSYLILLTIDPRLVRINTKLDPIVISTKEVDKFKRQLQSDFKALENSTKLTVLDLDIEIQKIAEKKKELNAQEEEYNVSGKSSEFKTEVEKLNQDINALEAKKIIVVANEKGFALFGKSVEALDKTDYGVGPATVSGFKSETVTNYDNYIRQLNTLGKHSEAQNLMRRKDFYSKQIDVEREFTNQLKNYSVSRTESDLEKLNRIYSSAIDLGFNSDPELQEQAMKIYGSRQERIKAIEAKK